ncbi:MAG: hypothetical protein AAB557_03780 [Patescibacteria group bacterium]
MPAETLRNAILKTITPQGEVSPGPHIIANKLTGTHWEICDSEATPEQQQRVMRLYGYDNLELLRTDVEALKEQLREELTPQQWRVYFTKPPTRDSL